MSNLSSAPQTFKQIAYLAARDLGIMRPAQTLSPDALQDMIAACNNMMDSWKLDRLMVLAQDILTFTLTPGQEYFTIGPAEVAPNFTAARPVFIEVANIILNTFNPVVRQPLALLTYQQWGDIRVQNLPNAIPQGLYYDREFNPITGAGGIYLWPECLQNYGLELYVWNQGLWNGFVDATTPYIFPPAVLELIQKQLAVRVKPMMRPYMKIELDEQTWADLVQLANKLKDDFEAYNAPQPLLSCDAGYLGSSQKGAWNYAIGEDRVFGRG